MHSAVDFEEQTTIAEVEERSYHQSFVVEEAVGACAAGQDFEVV
jgi:hypothetical protein